MTKKTKLILGAGFCVFGLAPFVLILATAKSAFGELEVAAILGAVGFSTFLMGWGAVHVFRNVLKGAPRVPLEPGEQVLHRLPANHIDGLVTYGGHLSFSNQRIVFQPHSMNLKVNPVVLRWNDIHGFGFGDDVGLTALRLGAALLTHHAPPKADVLCFLHAGGEDRFAIWCPPKVLEWLKMQKTALGLR
jgi:hypothetical protein